MPLKPSLSSRNQPSAKTGKADYQVAAGPNRQLRYRRSYRRYYIASLDGTRLSSFYRKRVDATRDFHSGTFPPAEVQNINLRRVRRKPVLVERQLTQAIIDANRELAAEQAADAVSSAMIGVNLKQAGRRLGRQVGHSIFEIYRTNRNPSVRMLADIALATGHTLHIEFRPVLGGYLSAFKGGSREAVQKERPEALQGMSRQDGTVQAPRREPKPGQVAA